MIDPLTIEFTLDSPDASFPRTFLIGNQIPILPKHKVEALPEETRFNNNDPYWYTNPVGTGPYKFVQYVEDQYIEYARNDDYWGGKPGPEKLFMKIMGPEVAMIALEKGELDYMYPTNLSEVNRLQANPNIDVVEATNLGQWFGLIPNDMTMNGAWRDPKIKQALLKSVDREGYVKTILQGYGKVRDSPFQGTAYECPTLTKWTYDPVEADKLWTEAGWPKEKRGEWVMDFMSWLGNQAASRLPADHAGGRAEAGLQGQRRPDRQLPYYRIPQWARARAARTMIPRCSSGVRAPTRRACPSLPTRPPRPTPACGAAPMLEPRDSRRRGLKTCWLYENPRVQELFALTAKETDPEKRIKYFQEMDCIFNQELPVFTTAAPSFTLEQEQAAAGRGLAERRQPGLLDADCTNAGRLLALAAVVLSDRLGNPTESQQ